MKYMQAAPYFVVGVICLLGCSETSSEAVSETDASSITDTTAADTGDTSGASASDAADGVDEGTADGVDEGTVGGVDEGTADGVDEGIADGVADGTNDGTADGMDDGPADGVDEGTADGVDEGTADGMDDGTADGMDDGTADGATDGATDAGAPIPDWVDPEVPEGPIPPPSGTGTTPEEGDFAWGDVGSYMISGALPIQGLGWDQYPQYGTAKILAWSDSEECVCFDIECTTCSAESCSAESCTYALNENHTLTKYHVELQSTEYTPHTVTFEVNISADPAITYTTIEDVLGRLERIPVEYWYGFQIITEFGRGIQFLHGSYFAGGAAAYGSMNYIDTQTADLFVLLHELGHTFEQYTRIGNPPTQEPQSNILNPIWRNAIRSDDNRTSWYGNNNEWEDMAEFALIHAQCLVEGSLDSLEGLSPERYRIWERILLNGTTINQ